jgi:hypothetical protein
MIAKIVKAIADKLYESYGKEQYKVYTEQVKQGFKEPCFFVLLINPTNQNLLNKLKRRSNTFDIHYFPKNENDYEDIYTKIDELFGILEFVEIEGLGKIRGRKMESEFKNGVLHFFVNYSVFVEKTDANEIMEDIQISQRVKG